MPINKRCSDEIVAQSMLYFYQHGETYLATVVYLEKYFVLFVPPIQPLQYSFNSRCLVAQRV